MTSSGPRLDDGSANKRWLAFFHLSGLFLSFSTYLRCSQKKRVVGNTEGLFRGFSSDWICPWSKTNFLEKNNKFRRLNSSIVKFDFYLNTALNQSSLRIGFSNLNFGSVLMSLRAGISRRTDLKALCRAFALSFLWKPRCHGGVMNLLHSWKFEDFSKFLQW